MTNKAAILFEIVFLWLVLIGLILMIFIPHGYGLFLFILSNGMGHLIGLTLLITYGTTVNTLYWKILLVFISITFIGGMIKLMHLPGADLLLLVGPPMVALTYFIRFIVKKNKGHLDLLKMLWVTSNFTIIPLIVTRVLPTFYIHIVLALFWIMMVDFVFLEFKRGKLNSKENYVDSSE